MRELGEAGYLSKENILVLKHKGTLFLYAHETEGFMLSKTALELPEAAKLLNAPVFNDKKKIGEVKEIFGPVKSPYFSISPRHGVKPEKLLHKKLYIN